MSFNEELREDNVAILVAWPYMVGGPMHEIKIHVQELMGLCVHTYHVCNN